MADEDDDHLRLPGVRPPSWRSQVREVRLFQLIEKYRKRMTHPRTGLPFEPRGDRRRELSLEQLAFRTGAGLSLALRVFFPVCLMVFAISFVWDVYGLLRSCSVAGAIGFGTNWVAIKMLFWPRHSRPVFGHGLVPSQRDQLVAKVADEVLENLINEELILRKVEETRIVERLSRATIERLRAVVADPEFKEDLKQMVLTYVAELASDPSFRDAAVRRAERSIDRLAGQRFRGWLVDKLRDVWRAPLIELVNREVEGLEDTVSEGIGHLDGVLERLPEALEARRDEIDRVLTSMLLGLVQEVDVRAIVVEQLEGVTTQQLEEAFLSFADDKLSYITLLGGIFGVIGGTVIVWPLGAAAALATGVVLLAVTDLVAYRLLHGRWRAPWDGAHRG